MSWMDRVFLPNYSFPYLLGGVTGGIRNILDTILNFWNYTDYKMFICSIWIYEEEYLWYIHVRLQMFLNIKPLNLEVEVETSSMK